MGRKDAPLVSTLASPILRAREMQYIEGLQQQYFFDNMKCPREDKEEEFVTEGVDLTELSILWFTFIGISVMSIFHFLYDQRRAMNDLHRQEIGKIWNSAVTDALQHQADTAQPNGNNWPS